MSNKHSTSVNKIAEDKNNLEDINNEVGIVSPGKMLSGARATLGLSQDDIAKKLNFRISLVQSIEEDVFDPLLPETFTRGYLCGYAKLVNISNKDILESYELINIAKIQCAEMQSFSKTTQKEAENSLVTWITYLIAAILIGSTFIWWLQDIQSQPDTVKPKPTSTDVVPSVDKNINNTSTITASSITLDVLTSNALDDASALKTQAQAATTETVQPTIEMKVNLASDETIPEEIVEVEPQQSKAVFTFTGDCWVSIYDATGERIAYGVKKTGYVMTISGIAPFKVDIGRPALTSIQFNGESIDMSAFDEDNIAKFTLPIMVE